METPRRTRAYRSHHLDSERWDHVTLRPGDVVISTSMKAGTTWMQRMVHYADLLADLEAQMRRVAGLTALEVAEEAWPELVAAARFDPMKQEAIRNQPHTGLMFEGGAGRFFHKGVNGRWRDVLTEEDLALYETAAAQLDPELRAWLEADAAGR